MPYDNRRLEGVKYLDTGKTEWIEMKPIIDVVNEALKGQVRVSGVAILLWGGPVPARANTGGWADQPRCRCVNESSMKEKLFGLTVFILILAFVRFVNAQQPGKMARLGFLTAFARAGSTHFTEAFLQVCATLDTWRERISR